MVKSAVPKAKSADAGIDRKSPVPSKSPEEPLNLLCAVDVCAFPFAVIAWAEDELSVKVVPPFVPFMWASRTTFAKYGSPPGGGGDGGAAKLNGELRTAAIMCYGIVVPTKVMTPP